MVLLVHQLPLLKCCDAADCESQSPVKQCCSKCAAEFLQVRENWKKLENLSGRGKVGKYFFGKSQGKVIIIDKAVSKK